MKESIKVKGYVKWELIRDGKVVDSHEGPNAITNDFKAALAALLNGTTAGNTLVTHMAFGTGTTRETSANTALGAELTGGGYSRVAVTRSNPSANVIQYQATLTGLTSAVTVNEAALVNAATAGKVMARKAGPAGTDASGPYGFGSVSLSSPSDSLQITWQVTFS